MPRSIPRGRTLAPPAGPSGAPPPALGVRRSLGRSGYLVFLIPGLVLSAAVVVVPLAMTIGTSFTRWQGVGVPEWIGLSNYVRLAHDPSFWASFRHIALLIGAVAIRPTPVG